MIQEGAHNPNVTIKGYPKKFLGVFGQKAHKTQQITLKTQQITLFHPKRRLSLTPMYQGQTYNSKCNPYHLPNETLGFSQGIDNNAIFLPQKV